MIKTHAVTSTSIPRPLKIRMAKVQLLKFQKTTKQCAKDRIDKTDACSKKGFNRYETDER